MRLADLESATDEQLRSKADDFFERAELAPSVSQRDSFLAHARFCLEQVEGRKNDKISRRDYHLELCVIALICLELLATVGFAIWGSRQQTAEAQSQLNALGKVQDVLSRLQISSQATADNLLAMKDTMAGVKRSVDRQVELFYDVQANVFYNEPTKKIVFINDGRANISIWAYRVGDETMIENGKPTVIAPSATFEFQVGQNIKSLSQSLPKGQTVTSSYTFLIKNEKLERFTVSGEIFASWYGETLSIVTRSNGILPGWTRQ